MGSACRVDPVSASGGPPSTRAARRRTPAGVRRQALIGSAEGTRVLRAADRRQTAGPRADQHRDGSPERFGGSRTLVARERPSTAVAVATGRESASPASGRSAQERPQHRCSDGVGGQHLSVGPGRHDADRRMISASTVPSLPRRAARSSRCTWMARRRCELSLAPRSRSAASNMRDPRKTAMPLRLDPPQHNRAATNALQPRGSTGSSQQSPCPYWAGPRRSAAVAWAPVDRRATGCTNGFDAAKSCTQDFIKIWPTS